LWEWVCSYGPVGLGSYAVTFMIRVTPYLLTALRRLVMWIISISGNIRQYHPAVEVTPPCGSPYTADQTNTVGLWHFEESEQQSKIQVPKTIMELRLAHQLQPEFAMREDSVAEAII